MSTPVEIPANDPINPDPLPANRCGNCAHWQASRRRSFGLCIVRPGVIPTYTGPDRGCDVSLGRAWSPVLVRA